MSSQCQIPCVVFSVCGDCDNVTRLECKCSLSALAGVKGSVGAGIQTSGPTGVLKNNGTSLRGDGEEGEVRLMWFMCFLQVIFLN